MDTCCDVIYCHRGTEDSIVYGNRLRVQIQIKQIFPSQGCNQITTKIERNRYDGMLLLCNSKLTVYSSVTSILLGVLLPFWAGTCRRYISRVLQQSTATESQRICTRFCRDLFCYGYLWIHKNIKRHTAHTIVNNDDSSYFRFDDDNKTKYIFSQSSQGKWVNWKHTAPYIV